jgi:hypothetical protein
MSGEVHTGVFVGAGDLVSVAGSGTVNVGSFLNGGLLNPIVGPEGFPFWTPPLDWPSPDPSLVAYSLIWKIGSSAWFQGGAPLAAVSSSGEIILAINDAWPLDNSRGWSVTVKVDSPDPVPRQRGEPSLRITFVEAIQIIQRSDNSVPLVAKKRTMLRVFIDSGIRDGSDFGQGVNQQPNVTGSITLTQRASRSRITLAPDNADGVVTARPVDIIDRADLTHSLNFTLNADQTDIVSFDARVFVRGHEGDTRGGFVAFHNRPITFQARQPQELWPILLQDNHLGLGAPTIGDYGATLIGAIARYPISDDGYIVHPPLVLPAIVDLTTLAGWQALLFLLTTLVLYFPEIPFMRGIRTALVQNDPRYAVNGIGMTRYITAAPTFIARANLPATFAHEMGHCFNIGHASCPPAGAPNAPTGLDARLPASTEDLGVSMQSALTQLIPAGTGELMSYCDGQSRWPSIAFINALLLQPPL